MKKIISICLVAMLSTTSLFAAPTVDVAEKVLQIFKASFPDVEKPVWSEYDTYYGVYFKTSDNMSCRVFYTLDGNILSTQRYYLASGLSPFIRTKVYEKYPQMKISGVTEVSSDDELTYHIILEDNKRILNISSGATGILKVEDKMKKRE